MTHPRALLRFTFIVAILVFASDSIPANRNRAITLDDYFTQAYITSVAISPDNKWVAYTEMRWEPPAETRNTELWVVSTSGGGSRRLTFDPATDASAQWSTDSKWIYFTSSRGEDTQDPPQNGKSQVWRVSVEGGEPHAVTRLKDGINSFALSRTGDALFYSVSSEEFEDEWKEIRKKFKDVQYGDGIIKASELWKLDLKTWRTVKLIAEKRTIQSFAVSDDESRIAMISTPTNELITNEGWSTVDIYDAATGLIASLEDTLWRELAPSPYGWIESLSWSPNGTHLAFEVSFDGYPAELFVASWNGVEFESDKLTRPDECGIGNGTGIRWMPNSRDICIVAEQRACLRVMQISGAGGGKASGHRILTPGEHVVEQYDLSHDGRWIAANISDTTSPGNVYLFDVRTGKRRQLTDVNPQMADWILPRITKVQWIGARGDSCEGILELPRDYSYDKPLPTLVCVHGGPTDADVLRFEYWIYGRVLFSSLGWAVFCPNYRGSTGYGDSFLTDLIGNENNIEVEDILRGVDEMVKRGIADSSKLAVSGWSNGGYLTNCLITKTNRFKAASSGAGVLDMAMQWGTEDTPGHVINYMQGLPWEKPDEMRHASPLYDLDKVTTPTLIHVGENDARVPASHSKALHRALHHYLGVPSELIVYPGQGHGITKLTQRRTKMEWDIEWFKKYVLDPPLSTPPRPAQ